MIRPLHLTAALLLTALTLTGCGTDDTSPPTVAPEPSKTIAPAPILVRGQFELPLPGFMWSEATHDCTGRAGYDDLRGGTQVVITDPTGASIAIGKFDTGQPVKDPTDDTRATSCLFTFDIPNVPGGKGIYGIEVSNRGVVKFKEADLYERVQLGLT